MKRLYLILALLAIAGIGSSYLLIPQEKELALMNLKDKKYMEARLAYEKQLDEGKMTVAVVMPLMKLHLHYGELDAAIELMERFVEQQPENLEARRELGKLYQYAQRPDDYVANLEAIRSMGKADAQTLESLSNIYNFNANYERQIAVLEELVRSHPDNPEHYLELAYLQAGEKHFDAALNTLLKLHSEFPQAMPPEAAELLVSLLLDGHRAEEALHHAENWLEERDPAPEYVARIARLFRVRSYGDQAIRLIKPYQEQLSESPKLQAEWLEAQLLQGKEQFVYEQLTTLYLTDKLPYETMQTYLELAFKRKDYDRVEELIENVNLNALSESTLATLVEVAALTENEKLLKTLSQKTTPEFLDKNPVLAAVLALAYDDPVAPSQVAVLEQEGNLTKPQIVLLARASTRAGYSRLGIRLMEQLAPYESLNDSELGDLAELYIRTDQAKAGYELFTRMKETRNTPATIHAWARLAVHSGNTVEVATWLEAREARELSNDLLRDLYFAAVKQDASKLALMAAKRLDQRLDSRESKQYLANALLKNDQALEAAALLEPLMPAEKEMEDTYLAALYKAAKQDPKYKKALRTMLSARLNEPDISSERKQELVYAIIEYGGEKEALPYIRDLAYEIGNDWAFLYEDMLSKQNKQEELTTYRKYRALSPTTPREEKLRLAHILLETDKEVATEVFFDLAKNAGPKSDAVQQVLYLWGPRPAPAHVKWLTKRASEANRGDRAAWLSHLLYTGRPEKVVQVVENTGGVAGNTAEATDHYLEALARLKHREKLAEVIAQEIKTEPSHDRKLKLAELAFNQGEMELAQKTYQEILEANPEQPEVLRNLGVIAYYNSAYTKARRYLHQYEALAQPDYEVLFYLGELAWIAGDRGEAEDYYEASLQAIAEQPVRSRTMKTIEAQSRYRLGERNTALAMFRELLRTRPGDSDLRADFTSVLIETRLYEEAQSLLSEL